MQGREDEVYFPPPMIHDSRYARKPPPAASRDAQRAAMAEVRAVYAELDRRPLDRQCTRLTECCQFKRTGLTPSTTRGEALVAVQALRATGRKRPPESNTGACPMLDAASGKCLIYADRPFGCRTHFCRMAGGPAARRDVLDLIRRLEDVDAALNVGDGPKPLPAALEAAGL